MIATDILNRTSKTFVPLTRRQREGVADQLYRAQCPERAYHCACVDPNTWETLPEPHALVVLASTADEARHAWERYAEDAGVTGKHRLALTVTEPAKERQRERERATGFDVDLDMLVLSDELAAADRALGL